MAGRTDQILPKLMAGRAEAKVVDAKIGENKIGARVG
jgi:hypothetical protein